MTVLAGTTLVQLAVESGTEGTFSPLAPRHWSEVIVISIFFLLLLLFIAFYVAPRFERAYRQRTQAIEGGIQQAASAQAEADALLTQYKAQMQEARGEAARIRTDAQAERAELIEAARQEAREAAAQETERARQQLQADLAHARAELSRDVGRIAVELASSIVGENLAERDATRRTVDRFLEGLSDLTPTGAAVTAVPAGGPAGAGES